MVIEANKLSYFKNICLWSNRITIHEISLQPTNFMPYYLSIPLSSMASKSLHYSYLNKFSKSDMY